MAAAEAAPSHGDHGHGAEAHGDHAHGAEAHGDHGHGHGGGITNWFRFPADGENGPFGFAILNFVLLVYLLVRFGKKPFVQFLETRHGTIRDNLAEATRMRQEAQAKLDAIKGKLSNLDAEIAEIKAGVRADAMREKDQIIADARSQADQLIEAADRTLEDEVRRARRMLEREAVSAAMTAAEKMVRDKINSSDRKRINEDYFKQISAS